MKLKNKLYSPVLRLIGNTPLLPVRGPENGAKIFAKYEAANPGGSIKSRTAYWMIHQAILRGEIKEDTILLEATSGNQGIGVSMVGAALGLEVKIIMPESMSQERQLWMKAYGAEVILTPAGDNICQAIEVITSKAEEMAGDDSRIFWVNQFSNPDNPDVHRQFTAREILRQLEGPVDAFVSGIGTGGTLTGVGEVLKDIYPDCRIVALEPENAAILHCKELGHHIQEGIGDGLIPEVLNCGIIDEKLMVSDEDALNTARELAVKSGICVGISSGTNIYGARQIALDLGKDKNVVTILPDCGSRYFSKGIIYNGV